MNTHYTCTIDEVPSYLELFCNAGLHPFMLSLPGIGKTTQVDMFAKKLSAKLITECAALIDRLDIAGLPYTEARGAGRVTRFAPCELIEEISEETNPNGPATVVYWEELNAAQESVLPSLYRLFDRRAVGRFHLRENVFMVADGNPAASGSSGRDLPLALRRRFCWLSVTNELPTWEKWAVNHHIDARILAFFRTADFSKFLNDFDAKRRDRLTFSCPASWEKTSRLLPKIDGLRRNDERQVALAAMVGMEAATAFTAFLAHQSKMPNVDVILRNPETAALPPEAEIMALVVAGVVSRVVENRKTALAPALRLVARMVSAKDTEKAKHLPEYGIFLMRLLMRNDALREHVKASKSYAGVLAVLNGRPELFEAVTAFGQALAA
jgi:MoxR-like ATPase